MYMLFLDDERDPPNDGNDWIVVRRVSEFVKMIESQGLPSYISFDHDLGDDPNTGYNAAQWLAYHCMDHSLSIPEYCVHSQNPVGKKNIECYLKNASRIAG